MLTPATYPIYPFLPELDNRQNAIPSVWSSVYWFTDKGDRWVKLLHLPNEYSGDEAKLLCQESPDTWLAWIPNYGEIILHRSDFCY